MTYFDARELPAPSAEYVGWIDVMGIQSHMVRSVNVAANFVFKTHVAALESPRELLTIYPVMDGLYVTSPTREALEAFLRSMFAQLARVFVLEAEPNFRFVVKGAIAFGKVFHGAKIRDEASRTLASNPIYRAAIFLGIPVVDAHVTERSAPPFGLSVHASARPPATDASDPFSDEWWRWFGDDFDVTGFRKALAAYYSWARSNYLRIGYDPERIAVHEALAARYFAGA